MGYPLISMKVTPTNISGVWVLEGSISCDSRGTFSRLFCLHELREIIGPRTIVQINHSLTHQVGAIRGLHFQYPPNAELKIVRCLKGRVFDVAVDLRRGSSSLMTWASVELTPENHLALVIPEGCAHGFQVLSRDSELLYLHTAFYTPNREGAVRFDDPKIGVQWPLKPIDLSRKDLSHPYLSEDFDGLLL